MKRFIPQAVLTALVVIGMTAFAVFADSPNFKSATASVAQTGANAGSLLISFRETGLGNTPDPVAYSASVSYAAVYECVNNGGKNPSASNKTQSTGTLNATPTFSSGKNGSVIGTITLAPPPPTLNCPGGQREVLQSVTYSAPQLTDTSHNVSATITSSGPLSYVNPSAPA